MQAVIDRLLVKLKNLSAQDILQKSYSTFGDKLVFSTSLGAEDQVITEIISSLNIPIKIITLDTGRLFPETYDTIHKTVNRYNLDFNILFPEYTSVEKMVKSKGINSFYESIENRRLCCNIRKIEPLRRGLLNSSAWITGLRSEQSITRLKMEVVEMDESNNIIKINPLIKWTEKEVWDYIKDKNIPYNALHDRGFPSIGCQPCTRAIEKGEDIRAGRWWWENPESKECGLHNKNHKQLDNT